VVDKILIKWPKLTTAQVILCLVLFIALWLGFLTADIQYNRTINTMNTKNLVNQASSIQDLINKQGNLSSAQRQAIFAQFAELSKHGGFATNQDIAQNQQILQEMNQSFVQLNMKVDKLLNHTQ
jgi:hypothetical protein